MTRFELIDIDHDQLVDDFPSEHAALQRLRELATEFGWSTVDDLLLVRVDDQRRTPIAAEGALADLVRSRDAVSR